MYYSPKNKTLLDTLANFANPTIQNLFLFLMLKIDLFLRYFCHTKTAKNHATTPQNSANQQQNTTTKRHKNTIKHTKTNFF